MSESDRGARVVAGTEGAKASTRPQTPYDSLPEESYDRIVRLAGASLCAPVAIVSLIDDERHVVKSSIGLQGRSRIWRKVPHALRFAREAAGTARPVFVSGHAASDEAGADPSPSDGAAYAVVPIIMPDGGVIGTIAVMDTRSRNWLPNETMALVEIAALMATELELRSDLSLKRQTQEHLLYNTLHDALTGLANRSLFTERLRHAMRRTARHPDGLFAVLFLGSRQIQGHQRQPWTFRRGRAAPRGRAAARSLSPS